MSAKRLTSRNLFDDVFALLSTNVELDYGPTTVRDELALLSETNKDHMEKEFDEKEDEQSDILNDEVNVKYNDQDDYNYNNNKSQNEIDDNDEESWSTMRIPTILSAVYQTQKYEDDNLEKLKQKRHHQADNNNEEEENEEHEQKTSHEFVLPTLSVQMNAEDSAVQEATKYATYFDEVEDKSVNRKTSSNNSNNNHDNTMNSNFVQSTEANYDKIQNNSSSNNERMPSEVGRKNNYINNIKSRPHLTAQEQLQVMPLDELHRGVYYRGVCAMYRAGKGFGFIAPDLGGPDVYFIKDAVHFIFSRCVLRCYVHFNFLKLNTMSNNNNAPNTVETSNVTNNMNNIDVNDGNTAKSQNLKTITDIVMTSVDDDLPINESYLHHVLLMSQNEQNFQEPQQEELVGDKSVSKDVNSNTIDNEENKNKETHVSSSIEFEEVNTKIPKNEEVTQQSVSEFTSAPYYLQLAAKAALQLTESQSLLLAATLKYGQVSVRVRDLVEFNVVRNKASRQNSRLLRAENIRGVHSDAQNSLALPIEQAWFYNLFAEENNTTGVNTISNKDSIIGYIEELDELHKQHTANKLLVRYEGVVKYYDDAEDHQRGYIKINTASLLDISSSYSSAHSLHNQNEEEHLKSNRQYENVEHNKESQMTNANVHDIAFTSDAFLWSSKLNINNNNVPNDMMNGQNNDNNNNYMRGSELNIQVGMRVRFSVCGREKLHRVGGYRYNAILITGLDDQPLHLHNIVMDDNMIRRRVNNKESSSTNRNNYNNVPYNNITTTDNSTMNTLGQITNNAQQGVHATNNNTRTNGMFVEDEDDEDDYFNDERSDSRNSSDDDEDDNIDDIHNYYNLYSSTLNTSVTDGNNNNITSIEERHGNKLKSKQTTLQQGGLKNSDERLLYKNRNTNNSSQRKRQRDQDETLLLFDEDDYAMI